MTGSKPHYLAIYRLKDNHDVAVFDFMLHRQKIKPAQQKDLELAAVMWVRNEPEKVELAGRWTGRVTIGNEMLTALDLLRGACSGRFESLCGEVWRR